jgi:hypothetical protein
MKVCIVCEEEFDPKQFPNPNRKTCSDMCFRKLMCKVQKSDSNSNWKGGYSQPYYQRIRREIKEQKCFCCGKQDGRLDTHHLDRDKSNNSAENMLVLCASCHAFLHYIEDDRGLQGWNAAKAQELRDRDHYNVA